MRLLIVNVGSSSTKCSVLDEDDTLLAHLDLPMVGDRTVDKGIETLIEQFSPEASVHRVVHGGPRFRRATVVDKSIEADLAALGDLAPLHNPPALAVMEEVRSLDRNLPAVACFDTAFFADLPEQASTYALPEEWRERWGEYSREICRAFSLKSATQSC